MSDRSSRVPARGGLLLGLNLLPTLLIISIALPVASLLAVRHAKALWIAVDHFFDPPR